MSADYERKLHGAVAQFVKEADKKYPNWSERNDNGEWEIGLDKFDDMYKVILEIIEYTSCDEATEQMLDDILFGIARDNECSRIIEVLLKYPDWYALNIENTDTIDGMAYEQDTSSLILLLADGMDWSDMNRHLLLLQDKLNTYIWYIDSGQYEEKYPNVKRIEMRVSFLFEEPKLCHRLLEKAKHVFMNVFENVEMIVENGEIKEGEIYGQGSF